MAIALACEGLTKRFGGLEAITDLNLVVEEGERRAIIGPNGAGKTTLFKLISGEYPVTSGRIMIFGKNATRLRSYQRTSLGLGRTFQITNLCPTLSVLDNLILAQLGLQKMKYIMFKPVTSFRPLYEQARGMLKQLGMEDRQAEIVRYLSYGDQRQIEIAMALSMRPKVLLLDEPTSGLSPAESQTIRNLIKNLDPQITILIIEHDMDVAFGVARSITVLDAGKVFCEGSKEEIQNDPGVQRIYLGSE